MSTFAAVTSRETALISSSGILHGITPGALDGFAVGALATAACCLIVAGARLLRRNRLSARDGMWGTGARRSKVRRDYFAESAEQYSAEDYSAEEDSAEEYFEESVDADPAPAEAIPAATAVTSEGEGDADVAAAPQLFAPEDEALLFSPAATSELNETLAQGDRDNRGASVHPFADVADSDVILPGTRSDLAGRDPSGRSVYHSKHRITSSDADRRLEVGRGPRHAAPSARHATRMSGRSALPVAARS